MVTGSKIKVTCSILLLCFASLGKSDVNPYYEENISNNEISGCDNFEAGLNPAEGFGFGSSEINCESCGCLEDSEPIKKKVVKHKCKGKKRKGKKCKKVRKGKKGKKCKKVRKVKKGKKCKVRRNRIKRCKRKGPRNCRRRGKVSNCRRRKGKGSKNCRHKLRRHKHRPCPTSGVTTSEAPTLTPTSQPETGCDTPTPTPTPPSTSQPGTTTYEIIPM
ncbi:hypothetical protein BB559_002623 [Furculomyces boomerangus]|uniref:Uncharacterized protein n=2 Tax=Harpellales TaxID=61421 RepID=A0A2T9YTP2_9FUNG|nr:hypothetical protein BB559_002623 [Furculomyces boomerangus]PWA01375.1 hypothetical protein BB558_002529 [Smittium angustum]